VCVREHDAATAPEISVTSPTEASSEAHTSPDIWYARVCALIGAAAAVSLPMTRVRIGTDDQLLLESPWLRLMYYAGLTNVLFWSLRSFRFGTISFARLGWSVSFWWHGIPVALSVAFTPLAAAVLQVVPLSVLSVLTCLCLSTLALRSLRRRPSDH
jgi:hypothetical protein